VLVATLMAPPPDPDNPSPIDTFAPTVAGFGPPINRYTGSNNNDQPWIRTGPDNHVYVGFNDDGNRGPGNGGTGSGKTASVLVSTDGGNDYTPVVIDRVGTNFKDAPEVRLAVNGNTVYSAFVRWNSVFGGGTFGADPVGTRLISQVVVVRSDNGGADNFTALGGGNGVEVAPTIDVYNSTENTLLTLGQNRGGSGLAMAVDPNNSQHVLVVYLNAPNPLGQTQLIVSESNDGGGTWSPRFSTSSDIRSSQPAVAILANGAIGLLYLSYAPAIGNPATGTLSQHFVTTTDDFATTNDVTLASATNTTPVAVNQPYIGDYFDLTGIGNTFYGVFSASNADTTKTSFADGVSFNRDFTGTPGTSSFQLTDTKGNPVAPSIDPFFFSYSILNPAAPPGVSANMVLRNSGNGQYQIYNLGNNSILASYWLGQVGTDWAFVTLGNFNDGNTSDMLLRNSTSGAFQVYNIPHPNSNNITGSASLGTVGLEWQVLAFGNFDNVGNTDMILRDVNTATLQVYNIANNQVTGSKPLGAVGLDWQFSGVGHFSGRDTSDLLLHNSDSGGLQVYNISNNQITGSAFMGTVGPDWQFSGIGHFSVPGESDLLLRNSSTGALQLYNIKNDQITGSQSIGTVGVDWTFAGVAPVSADGVSDLVLRNDNSGAFQVYNIANNQITGSEPLGTVGLDWQLPQSPSGLPGGGFAPSSPSGLGLVQAMAGFGGGSGAGESVNATPLSADTSQQTFLTTPQHA